MVDQILLAKAILGLVAATIPFATQMLTMLAARMEQRSFAAKAKNTLKFLDKLQAKDFDRTLTAEAAKELDAAYSKKNLAILNIMSSVNEWVPSHSKGKLKVNGGIGVIGGGFIAMDWEKYPDSLGVTGFDAVLDVPTLVVMGISTLLVQKYRKQLGLISATADARIRLFKELKAYFEDRFFILLTQGTFPLLIREMGNDADDEQLQKLLKQASTNDERR